MNIAMILETPFPPDVRVENEARVLAEAGHRVHILCVTSSAEPKFEQYSPRVFVHRWSINRLIHNKLRGTLLRFPLYGGLWKTLGHWFIRDHQIDAIHVHDLPLASVGLTLAHRFRIPFILDLHENYPAALKVWSHTKKLLGSYFYYSPLWEQYERNMVREANRVVVVAEEMRDRLARIVDLSKIVVLPNTLNLNTLPQVKDIRVRDKGEFRVLYFGGFGPHRGLATAIRAMVPVVQQIPSARLYLVGDGSDRQDLIRLTNELSLEKYVNFCGGTPCSEATQDYLVPSDVCLIPAENTEHTETTIPHKLFQYMYFEKPVIVSDCRPLKRIVEETNCGLIFQAGNAEALGAEITKLFRERSLRETLGKNGNMAVLQKYNWKNTSRELIQLYKQIESERNSGGHASTKVQ